MCGRVGMLSAGYAGPSPKTEAGRCTLSFKSERFEAQLCCFITIGPTPFRSRTHFLILSRWNAMQLAMSVGYIKTLQTTVSRSQELSLPNPAIASMSTLGLHV